MKFIYLIKSLALGAFVGCFIVMLVMVIISLSSGVDVVSFSGRDIINAFLGSIVAGWGFSLTSFIYERDIAFPLQVIFQMGIGMTLLLIIAIYLHWMPIEFGLVPIITWMVIALIFGAVFWGLFMAYYYLLARELNNKISKKNF